MKEHQIQLQGLNVSGRCRTYSYQVIDPSGDTRQFEVAISLEWFKTSPLKFQDGPLISRELLLGELDRETSGVVAKAQLNIEKSDVVTYMERHYPPKARNWNRAKPPEVLPL